MARIKVAIDAGHGWGNVRPDSYDSGATGGGALEADLAMDYAKSLKEMLRREGVDVHMVSTGVKSDENPVSARDNEATANGCTHMLSIHLNAGPSSATGTETLYRNDADKAFSRIVHDATIKALKLKNRGLQSEKVSPHGSLAVMAFPGPNALIELGFITNAKDLARIQDKPTRLAWAETVAAAIKGLG